MPILSRGGTGEETHSYPYLRRQMLPPCPELESWKAMAIEACPHHSQPWQQAISSRCADRELAALPVATKAKLCVRVEKLTLKGGVSDIYSYIAVSGRTCGDGSGLNARVKSGLYQETGSGSHTGHGMGGETVYFHSS